MKTVEVFRIHKLKTWPEPFAALRRGDKTHEIRKDDRHFNVGDVLILQEFEPGHSLYTGEEEIRLITYKSHGWGLPDGLTVLSVKPCELKPKKCADCGDTFRTYDNAHTHCAGCI